MTKTTKFLVHMELPSQCRNQTINREVDDQLRSPRVTIMQGDLVAPKIGVANGRH